MGRRALKLDAEQKIQVEALASVLTRDQIADYFGIGRTTFHRMMERDTQIEERYKRGKAKAVGAIAQNLVQQARDGNMTAMIFFLKTQAGWKETQGIDLSGAIEVEKTPINEIFAK